MEFLNVLAIKKIAYRKGCTAERTTTIKHKHYVELVDPKGRAIDGAKRGVGFGLLEAKRLLEALPDPVPAQTRSRSKPSTPIGGSRRGARL